MNLREPCPTNETPFHPTDITIDCASKEQGFPIHDVAKSMPPLESSRKVLFSISLYKIRIYFIHVNKPSKLQ